MRSYQVDGEGILGDGRMGQDDGLVIVGLLDEI